MLGTLIETRASRPRRAGGTLVSVPLHTGLIGLAVAAIRIPTALPAIDPGAIVTNPNWYDSRTSPVPGRVAGDASGQASGPVDGAWDASAVDRAVVPSAGNPVPAYPPRMRDARLEGRVDVRFIVDTTGRAEPGSIQVLASTHASFTDAVRAALLRSRYQPAQARGRRVRQVVEQRFEFARRR